MSVSAELQRLRLRELNAQSRIKTRSERIGETLSRLVIGWPVLRGLSPRSVPATQIGGPHRRVVAQLRGRSMH